MKGIWTHKIYDDTDIKGTCFTRNKALSFLLASRSPVQFICDYNMLRNNNKIIPVNADYQLDKDTNSVSGYKTYSRSHNRCVAPWDEEYILGDITKFNRCLKGMVFISGNSGSFLHHGKKRELYYEARKYSKEFDIPFAVEKDYLREIQQHIIYNIWDWDDGDDEEADCTSSLTVKM